MDLNVALVIRLVDQITRPFKKVTGAIGKNADETGRAAAAGDRLRRASQGEASAVERVGSAAGRTTSRLTSLRRAKVNAGRATQAWNQQLQQTEERIAKLGMASFAFNVVDQNGRAVLRMTKANTKAAGDYQGRLEAFGIIAGVTGKKLDDAGRSAIQTGSDVHQASTDMLGGLELLVGKGLELDKSLASLPAIGKTATATQAAVNDVAASGFSLVDNLKVAPQDLQAAFDAMNQAGKSGGFELKNMAQWFPQITANARALKMEGVPAVAELSAALQVALKGAGSPDQAANNMANFLSKLTSPESVRRFEEFGIDLEAEMQKAADQGVSPLEHILEVIKEATGGDNFKMGQLFGDMQVLAFLRPMIDNMEEFKRIRDEALAGGGSVDTDFERMATQSAAAAADYKNAVEGLQRAMGKGLLPVTMANQKAMAGFLNNLTQAAERFPRVAAGVGITTGVVGGLFTAVGTLGNAAVGLATTWLVLELLMGKAFMRMAAAQAALLGRRLLFLAARAIPAVIAGTRALTVAMVSNPIGLIVAAIAIAAVLIIANWSKVKAFFARIWAPIKPHWDAFAGFVKTIFGAILNFGKRVWAGLKSLLGMSPLEIIRGAWSGVLGFYSGLFGKIWAFARDIVGKVLGVLKKPIEMIKGLWDRVRGVTAAAGEAARKAAAPAAVSALAAGAAAGQPIAAPAVSPAERAAAARIAAQEAGLSHRGGNDFAIGRGEGQTSVRVEQGAIVVHAAPGQSEEEIARQVIAGLRRQGRGNLHDG